MANRAPIRLGQTGTLRAAFFDDAGLPIQASAVTVDLFEPDADPEVDTPAVSGLVPTYLGDGVYELAVTAIGPEGRWMDKWTGTILGVATSSTLAFNVIEGGLIEDYPTFGLQINNVVEITLSADIASLDGVPLATEYVFTFTTEYSPLFSSVRKVRLEVGAILGDIPNDTINLAIFEASLEANELTWKKDLINKPFYEHARREYVTCRAASVLLNNAAAAGLLKSKTLDNFQVVYDTQAIHGLMDRVMGCADKWAGQLAAGGGLNVARSPRMVVKGDLDPDRPEMRRMVDERDPDSTPAANTSYRAGPGSRRSVKGYVRRTGKDRLW